MEVKQKVNCANKNIIVTGGAGVIGQELINRLLSLGANVKCFDLVDKPNGISNKVEYVKKDLASLKPQEFSSFNPEVVFHLAATFERSVEEANFWESNFKNNIIVSHNVIDGARACVNLQRLIFASSYLIYSPSLYLFKSNRANPLKLRETDLVNPRNLCGSAKYYTEKELEFLTITNLPFTNISGRIFRVYGLGSRDIISRWVRAGLRNETIKVYGEENSFDYIFAGDVAEGLLRLAESDATGIVNIGTGISTKIEEVVQNLQENIPNIKIERENKETPIEKSAADVSKLKKETNWVPSVRINEGIKSLTDYERNRLHLKK
jgi:nucleoside-diphosphate-sugar epimerase